MTDLPFESLPVEAGTSTNLVAYLPEPGSPSEDALALLASWTVREQTTALDEPDRQQRA